MTTHMENTTKKVVINDCFGGFSLSLAGETDYLARKGKTPYFYANVRGEDGRIDFHRHVRVDPESTDLPFVTFTLLEDVGDSPTDDELNSAEWFNDRDVKRDDRDLVAMVEEMGDAAAGSHASLKIVEIPADVQFIISEYDGLEHIAEDHRTWA